ncbi:MAG: hypothetical protein RLZ98_3314 [Pseudomonadota bacterium]
MRIFLTDPEWVSAVSQAATTVVAIIAAVVAWVQLRAARHNQREATANAIYSSQLQLDLKYPDFNNPDYEEIVSSGRYSEYQSYVSHLFWACNEILEISDDPTWRFSVLYYLAFHTDHIKSPNCKFGELAYSKRMQNLMREAVSRRDEILLSEPALITEFEVRRKRKEFKLVQADSKSTVLNLDNTLAASADHHNQTAPVKSEAM